MEYLEIFSLICGLVYVYLQVKQSNWMWPVDILSCIAATVVFCSQRLWANAGLNVYYIVMAVWGIFSWLRDSGKVQEDQLHLRRPSRRVLLISAIILLAGGTGLILLLGSTGDSAPVIDGIIGITGVVGAWWLANSYKENWYVWMVSDALGTALCISQGLWWMACLYAVYTAVSVAGLLNWRKKGIYVD